MKNGKYGENSKAQKAREEKNNGKKKKKVQIVTKGEKKRLRGEIKGADGAKGRNKVHDGDNTV